jgi:two-component system, LytTR family, response regulator LytT
MEVSSNAQAATLLSSLHLKRSDLALNRLNDDDRNKQFKATASAPMQRRSVGSAANVSMSNEVFLKIDNRLIRFSLDEFLYLENVGDYVSIKTTKGSYVIHATMKAMELKLGHPSFVKVHRSYIINISKIAYIEDNSIVIDKKLIPISRAHKADLLEKLNVL